MVSDDKIPYCVICGRIVILDLYAKHYVHSCPYCGNRLKLRETKYDYEYYRDKAERYNKNKPDTPHIKKGKKYTTNDILVDEEASKNPEFKLYLYKSRSAPTLVEANNYMTKCKTEYEKSKGWVSSTDVDQQDTRPRIIITPMLRAPKKGENEIPGIDITVGAYIVSAFIAFAATLVCIDQGSKLLAVICLCFVGLACWAAYDSGKYNKK